MQALVFSFEFPPPPFWSLNFEDKHNIKRNEISVRAKPLGKQVAAENPENAQVVYILDLAAIGLKPQY